MIDPIRRTSEFHLLRAQMMEGKNDGRKKGKKEEILAKR
jgi:hypothetical protein